MIHTIYESSQSIRFNGVSDFMRLRVRWARRCSGLSLAATMLASLGACMPKPDARCEGPVDERRLILAAAEKINSEGNNFYQYDDNGVQKSGMGRYIPYDSGEELINSVPDCCYVTIDERKKRGLMAPWYDYNSINAYPVSVSYIKRVMVGEKIFKMEETYTYDVTNCYIARDHAR